MHIQILLTALLTFSAAFSSAVDVMSVKGNKYVSNFAEAKRLLPKIYSDHQLTLYCGCKYYGKEVNMNSCNSSSEGQSSRYKRLEWEHVVPMGDIKSIVRAWSEGDAGVCVGKIKRGRKCAERSSALFRQIEGDLYNLWPESGGINALRSDKPPVEAVLDDPTHFGSCETLVGKKTYSPRPEIRGEIARTYLYMSEVYLLPLPEKEVRMFQKWSAEDPVTAWECERAQRIKKVQGNANHFVEEACDKS